MTKIRALIVDDEESARNILFNLLQTYRNDIDIIGQCENVVQAVEFIKENKPDLVFLDIEMPNYSGLELVQFFEEISFDIIFITAYHQFAIKAFEISAFDYLLKPIEIARLDSAIKKYIVKSHQQLEAINYKTLKENLSQNCISKLIVSQQGGQKAILLSDIIALQANEAYTTIYDANGQQYTMSKNLKYFEQQFSDNKDFLRVHKSWLVNAQHIRKYSSTDFSIYLSLNIEAKLSKYKKAEFDAWYKS
ncbi:MAG: response regulator [Chitinophagales bacterium]|nr:response regulator [Chitinophagales bacterium]